MAKNDESKTATTNTASSNGATPPAVPATETAAAPAAAASAVPDERYRKLVLDDAGATFAYGDASKAGQSVNRIDYIRSAWTVMKQGRGAIAKEVSRLAGKKVTYQIVFSATKGVAGGPAPAPAATPASGAAAS
jgi:hypothetical protein